MYSYGKTLSTIRKKKHLTQQMLADLMTARGLPTKGQAISAWEQETHNMNVYQFLTICDILGIDNMNQTFHVAVDNNPLAKLTEEGKRKAYEYIDLLLSSGRYEKKPTQIFQLSRRLQVFDQAASAGTGEFLDSDGYDLIEVGPEVPETAMFGVKLSGDSMEPTIKNHSIVWVHKQDSLISDDVGVFYVDGNAYCKRFFQYADSVKLLSDNPKYKPIDIQVNTDFKIFGKVVAHTAYSK